MIATTLKQQLIDLNTFWVVIIISLGIILPANPAEAGEANINQEFNSLTQEFYKNQIELAKITDKLIKIQAEAEKITPSFKKYYWQARTYFLQAEINQRLNNKQQVVNQLQKSKQLIKKSLTEEKRFSDSYRLLADIHARLIEYKGAFYAIRYGNKILELLNQAVELDQNNYTASNSLGVAYLKAPKLGVGSVEKAINYLQQALHSNKAVDNFWSYYWLVKCYQEQKKYQQAVVYLNKAQVIYPDNPRFKKLADELKNKSAN